MLPFETQDELPFEALPFEEDGAQSPVSTNKPGFVKDTTSTFAALADMATFPVQLAAGVGGGIGASLSKNHNFLEGYRKGKELMTPSHALEGAGIPAEYLRNKAIDKIFDWLGTKVGQGYDITQDLLGLQKTDLGRELFTDVVFAAPLTKGRKGTIAEQMQADVQRGTQPLTPAQIAELRKPEQKPVTPEALPFEQMDIPLETSAQSVAEMQARGMGQRDLFAPINEPTANVIPDVSPRVIPKPIETIRQTDFEHEFGPISTMPNMRIDENGMPVRSDISIEAQQLQNPLQRNLWGDELGPALDQVRSLTEAIDSMPDLPWKGERDTAIEQLKHEVKPDFELPAEPTSGTGSPLIKLPGSQRGGIDAKTIYDEIKRMQENASEESSASMEAINRLRSEIANDQNRVVIESNSNVRELQGADRVDYKAKPGEVVAQRGIGKQEWTVLDSNAVKNTTAVLNRAKVKLPKSQQGGLNFKDIREGLFHAISPEPMKGSDKPVPIPPNKAEVLNKNLPGMEKITRDYIPPDPTVADTKAAALAEGGEKGRIVLKTLRAGGQMVAAQRKSALILNTTRMVLNGVKRAERSIKTFVEPVEKSIGTLNKNDTIDLTNLLKKEMFDGEKVDIATLSPRMKAGYESLRRMQEEVLQAQNEARLEMGMEPITPRDAYLSSRWSGAFRIPVYEKSGKLVWYIAENTRIGAKNALKYLQEHGVDVDTTKSKLEFRASGEKNRGTLENAYLTMLDVLGKDDPRRAEVKSIMEEAMANNAYDSLGQKRHFEPKSDVRGFIGDQPWKSEKSNAYGLLRQQMRYAKNGFQWAGSQRAVSKIKELLADPELQAAQPNNMQYVRDYVKQHLGYGDNKVIRAFESYVSDKLGVDRAIGYEGVSIAKALFLTQKLALNAGYYVSQLLQPLNATAEHGSLSSQGFSHNPVKTLAMTNMDFAAKVANGILDTMTGKRVNIPMSSFGKDAWKYMEENGISNRSILDEAAGLGERPVLEGVKAIADWPIAKSEQLIRSNVFLSFAHHLKQSGKFKDDIQLFQRAEEATNLSMVDFRREERAMMFSKFGMVGRGAETLKSYIVNYYNNVGRYAQDFLNGNPRAFFYMLAIQGMVYGAMNLPGVEEIHDLWEALKNQLPDTTYAKVKDLNVKQALIDTLDDWAYGGASKITGANLSTRGQVAIDQSFALDGMFPFLTDAYKQAQSVAALIKSPDRTTAMQAAYSSAPSGPIQGTIAMSDAFQAGKNAKGETIYQKPSKLAEHEFDYARTPEQRSYKEWGLTALSEAKNKDQTQIVREKSFAQDKRRKEGITKMFDALVRKDSQKFNELKSNYFALDGDPDQLVDGLIREAYKMRVSPERLQALSLSNIPSIKKIQELKQILGEIR